MRDAAYFETRLKPTKARDRLWPVLVEYLQQKFIPKDSVVLDIGAGYCHFINNVKAKEKHAVDSSSTVSEYSAKEVTAHIQSCEDLSDLSDAHFDLVFASNIFEHLMREQFLNTLSEIKRVLKPRGKLLIIQPNFRLCYKRYFDDYTHVQIFTDQSLADILAVSGFRVTHLTPRFLPFSIKTARLHSSWLVRLYLQLPIKPFAGQMLLVAESL